MLRARSMTDPEDQPLEPGRRFGHFELVRLLGEGGGGQVWEARDNHAGRSVALKVLTKIRAESPEARERFEREARMAASVRHPRCVYILGGHEVDGLSCISMELMHGGTLADLTLEGPADVQEAVELVLELNEGLSAAHRAGVLHRDVKPSNCFLEAEGRGAKLGDFGVSKVLEEPSDLSVTGAFLGTFHYASPEQIRGDELDERSDLYSLGATLYELLTGRRPFEGSAMAVAAQIISDEPPAPSTLNAEVPKALDRIVLKLLRKPREERFGDCAELRAALEPFRADRATAVPAGVWRRILAYLLDMALVFGPLSALPLVIEQLGPLIWAEDPGLGELYIASALVLQGIYFLYFWTTESRWGRSLGKWILGLRVEKVSGGSMGLWQAAVRAGTLSAVFVLAAGAGVLASGSLASGAASMVELSIGVALLAVTMRRASGWRSIHDVVSGTIVVREPQLLQADIDAEGPPEIPLRVLGPSTEAPSTVGSFAVTGTVWDTGSERLLLGHDGRLDRPVWIHVYASTKEGGPIAGGRAPRPGSLHWLEGEQTIEGGWDAYGAPTGCSLVQWVESRGPLDWPDARDLLMGLSATLATRRVEPDQEVDLARVWVAGPGRVVLLDIPTRSPDIEAHSGSTDWLQRAALFCLEGEDRVPDPDYTGPERLLPLRATAWLSRLFNDGVLDPGEAEHDLSRLRTRRITPKRRLAMIAAGAAIPTLFSLAWMTWEVAPSLLSPPEEAYLTSLAQLDLDLQLEREESDGAPSMEDTLVITRLLDIRRQLADPVESAALLDAASGRPFGDLTQSEEWLEFRDGLDTLASRFSSPSFTADDDLWEASRWSIGMEILFYGASLIPVLAFVASGLLATVTALVMRGGPILSEAEAAVATVRGKRASRLRCAGRTFVAWTPALLGITSAYFLASVSDDTATSPIHMARLSLAVAAPPLILWLVGIRFAIRSPTRGLQERLTGTVPVPK